MKRMDVLKMIISISQTRLLVAGNTVNEAAIKADYQCMYMILQS